MYSKHKVAWKSYPKAGMVKSAILFKEDTQIASCIEIVLNVLCECYLWFGMTLDGNSFLTFDSVGFDN